MPDIRLLVLLVIHTFVGAVAGFTAAVFLILGNFLRSDSRGKSTNPG